MRTRGRTWATFTKNKSALVGGFTAALVVLVTVLAPFIAPHDPFAMDARNYLASPGGRHPLGTDRYGRDTLSRILWGGRVSLAVGLSAVGIGMCLGTSLGLIAGYRGGLLDLAIMRGVDVLLSFPGLITGLMVMAILGPGLVKLIVTIGIVLTPRFARVAYGPTLVLREKDFVAAARSIGSRGSRIVIRHLLPNILGEVLVMGTLWIGTAIIYEASLSFIGLGISPPTPTWGNMIKDGVQFVTFSPWLSIFPGLAILITVLSLNMLGDGIRDVTDPKLQV